MNKKSSSLSIKNISPLRYPGGKTRARKILLEIYKTRFDVEHHKILYSPFFGGGSFEFFLLKGSSFFEECYVL